MSESLNAVEQRLVELQSHWQDFRGDDSKRMLLWQVRDNAARLMECFFAVQRLEATLATPYVGSDTFIVFDTPFEDSISYSRKLKEALAGEYGASRESFQQADREPDWNYSPAALPDSARGFIESLNDLTQHHQDVLGLLVAVVLPSSVAGEDAWTAWLERALAAGPGPGLRLLVLDSLETPRCGVLAESGHPQLRVEPLAMDAWELAGETFAQEAAVGPPGVFRSLLTGLFALVEKGTADQVMAKANDALAFARSQGWGDQEVAVRMLAAGAMLKERRFEEAVNHYRHARITAEELTVGAHPAGRDLELQSWFGEASAWLAAGDLPEASRCYQGAEAVAEAIPKPILWIESLRMGAFCHVRNNERVAAAECCERALQVGARMKPEARCMTTLPLVALEALRLLDAKRTAKMEVVKQSLDADLARLHDEVEQAAAKLERDSGGGERLRALERLSDDKGGALTQAAAREIDTLAAGGERSFVETLWRIRGLLWSAWPLDPLPQEEPVSEALAESEEVRS